MKLNNITKLANSGMITLLLISLTLLQACGVRSQHSGQAESGKQARVITVTSNPTGAIVRADGKKLGETPIKVDLAKAFSPEWVSGENYGVDYRLNGELIFEKSGCKDYVVPVSDTEPSDDISITLICNERKQQANTDEPVKSTMQENTEQRLKKLDKLYKEGAISKDEYKQHRSRILGEL